MNESYTLLGMEKEDLLDTLENSTREREKLGQTIVRMAKAREDLVKEKHQLKEDLGMVEMKLDSATEQNKRLSEDKTNLEQSLHNTEQR